MSDILDFIPINGHFLLGKDGEYYDITGKTIPAYGAVKWAEMETIDPVWYQRVKKHCVNNWNVGFGFF